MEQEIYYTAGVVTDRHTDRYDKYRNPCCACAPRDNYTQFKIRYLDVNYSGYVQRRLLMFTNNAHAPYCTTPT